MDGRIVPLEEDHNKEDRRVRLELCLLHEDQCLPGGLRVPRNQCPRQEGPLPTQDLRVPRKLFLPCNQVVIKRIGHPVH